MSAWLQGIYQQGWEAKPGTKCPWPYNSTEGRVWMDGYNDNQKSRPDGIVQVAPLWTRLLRFFTAA